MSTNAPTIPNAVMLDRVIGEIQEGLIAGLPWLDVAFGRSQRLTKKVKGKNILTPNVYCGGWNGHGENDYIEVSPDSKIGNFCFFEIEDPETIDAGPWAREIRSPFSLIFWFDLRRVYNEASNRNVEYLKGQVLHVLNGRMGWHLSEGRITVTRIYERTENIYRGYSLSEIDNQYLMHPFAGFRIDGTLEFAEICFDDTPPVPPTPTPVVPVVPAGAIQFDAVRFALGSVGDGELFRIRGNSAILNGSLTNLMLEKFDIYGYNQIDPTKLNWQSASSYYLLTTSQFKIVPGKQYVVFYEDAFENQTSQWEIHLVIDGGIARTKNIVRGEPITIDDGAIAAYISCHFSYGAYANNLIVALYDDGQPGNPTFYKKSFEIDVTKLSGFDSEGRVTPLFSEGLLMAGNGLQDEIYETVAVRRVGMRAYRAGDENNPDLLTDGVMTNYPLPTAEVFTIVESLDFGFNAERGGTVFQTPETLPAPLDIVIT